MDKVAIFAAFFSSFCVLVKTYPMQNPELFEGDIIGISPWLFQTKSGLSDPRYRWPNATIPFQFADDYPEDLEELFQLATEYISARTCIKFVPQTDEPDFIFVIEGNGCYSNVGRLGDEPQDISLPAGCKHLGIFVHELMHSIGFFHEQSRTDRDNFVEIIWKNVIPRFKHNFQKYDESLITSFGVEYDFDSVMHYQSNAFSVNGNDTIRTKPPGIPIGLLYGMSPKDVLKVNRMYNCSME